MATFNGAAYLTAQLQSLADQSRRPDLLVVCDDASHDRTWDILTEVGPTLPFEVELRRNHTTLGYAKNFEQAMGACVGRADLVALCDQDDVWLPNKLARLEAVLAELPEAQAAFSNGQLTDSELRPLGTSLWEAIGFSRRELKQMKAGRGFSVLMRHNVMTGAASLVRRELVEAALPIPRGWPHDAWLALVGAVTGGLYPVEDELFMYRQHQCNQIGASRRGLAERLATARSRGRRFYSELHQRYEIALEELVGRGLLLPTDRRVDHLRGKVEHLKSRVERPTAPAKKIAFVAWLLARGEYHRFEHGVRSAVRDLLS